MNAHRKRTEMACSPCRQRKIKCESNKPYPCESCKSKNKIAECEYLPVADDHASPPPKRPSPSSGSPLYTIAGHSPSPEAQSPHSPSFPPYSGESYGAYETNAFRTASAYVPERPVAVYPSHVMMNSPQQHHHQSTSHYPYPSIPDAQTPAAIATGMAVEADFDYSPASPQTYATWSPQERPMATTSYLPPSLPSPGMYVPAQGSMHPYSLQNSPTMSTPQYAQGWPSGYVQPQQQSQYYSVDQTAFIQQNHQFNGQGPNRRVSG